MMLFDMIVSETVQVGIGDEFENSSEIIFRIGKYAFSISFVKLSILHSWSLGERGLFHNNRSGLTYFVRFIYAFTDFLLELNLTSKQLKHMTSCFVYLSNNVTSFELWNCYTKEQSQSETKWRQILLYRWTKSNFPGSNASEHDHLKMTSQRALFTDNTLIAQRELADTMFQDLTSDVRFASLYGWGKTW